MDRSYDLVVIGSGTGGYSAAIRAAELGLKVALVERDGLGGTCLIRGCVPTKTLLYAAELIDDARSAASFGITFGEPEIDWRETQRAKAAVVRKLTRGLEGLLNRRKIRIIEGIASLAGSGRVSVGSPDGETELEATNILIATGSTPKSLPGIDIDGEIIVDSDRLLEIDRVPGSMAIIGGGYIGCEFASCFNSFGTKVALIEAFPELLAREDREIKERIAPALEKSGIDLRLGAKVEGARKTRTGAVVELSGEPSVEAEIALVATGRRPVTSDLGLERLGARTDARGYVEIDEEYLAAPGVYAVGDCIATLALAHAAFDEGYYVAEKIARRPAVRPNYEGIPHIVYCSPEVAAVGITEDEATARGLDFNIARFPFQANSRAATMKESAGFAKLIAREDDGALIGVHLIGAHVSELIAEAMLAVNWEATAADLGVLHHPHPTLSEAIGEAALKLAGMPLHSP